MKRKGNEPSQKLLNPLDLNWPRWYPHRKWADFYPSLPCPHSSLEILSEARTSIRALTWTLSPLETFQNFFGKETFGSRKGG